MIRRLFLVIVMALLLVPGAAMAQTPPPRIIAIGDLHGDWTAWRAIVRAAGVMDDKGHWAGGKTILVQTGDVPDRGPDTLKIIDDLMRLQKEAKATGGQVVTLVGNHESMMMIGDLRYVDPGEYAAFVTKKSADLRKATFKANQKALLAAYRARDPNVSEAQVEEAWFKQTPLGMLEHNAAWRADGRIGRWVLKNPAAALIDGNLFVHGGLSTAYAALPIDEINRRVAAALTAADQAPTAIISDPDGPLWYRGFSMPPASAAAPAAPSEGTAAPPPAALPAAPGPAELDAVLKAYGARRMIIAHTPALNGIVIADGGRLVRIDTGISRAYNGKPSYLEIRGDILTPHVVERPTGGG